MEEKDNVGKKPEQFDWSKLKGIEGAVSEVQMCAYGGPDGWPDLGDPQDMVTEPGEPDEVPELIIEPDYDPVTPEAEIIIDMYGGPDGWEDFLEPQDLVITPEEIIFYTDESIEGEDYMNENIGESEPEDHESGTDTPDSPDITPDL